MRRLWDFVNLFPRTAKKTMQKKIPAWVREDLQWWNKLLPIYNGVWFFDIHNRKVQSLYTDTCLYGLGGCFFEGIKHWGQASISQSNAFRAVVKRKILLLNKKMAKNLDDPSINVHEVEAILLAFQTWALRWTKQRCRVYTDNTTAYEGLKNYALKGPSNAPLKQIFLLAARSDIVIEAHWIEGKKNGLANDLSRFDEDRLTLLCFFWQNPFFSINLQPLTYPQHLVPQS